MYKGIPKLELGNEKSLTWEREPPGDYSPLGIDNKTSCCCAIRAKAPLDRLPTNPSLKAGVSDGLI